MDELAASMLRGVGRKVPRRIGEVRLLLPREGEGGALKAEGVGGDGGGLDALDERDEEEEADRLGEE